jgi:uncharacterized membrane protein YfcA
MNALLLSLALILNGPVSNSDISVHVNTLHKKEHSVRITNLVSVALASMLGATVGATIGSIIGSHIYHS